MKESQHTEWKESWRDDYLRWICGFANAEGGLLVIGRNDKGMAVGVNNAKRLLQELPNKVRDILGMVAVNLVAEADKELVEIRVEPYPSPISYKGEYHYRSGSTKQMLKGAALDEAGAKRILGEKVGERVGKRVGENAGRNAGKKLTRNQQQILELLRQHPLKHIGPDRGGHWEVLQ